MSATLIKKLRGDLAALKADKSGPLLARLDAGETLPAADQALLDTYLAQGDELNTRIGELMERETRSLDAARRDAEFDALVGTVRPEPGAGGPAPELGADMVPVSEVGAMFVASPQFARAKLRGGNSDIVTVKMALIKSTDANGAPLAGVQRVRDQAQPQYPTPLLDACGFEPVSGNSFEYVTWPLALPEAGVVAEGAAKPEAADSPELVPGVLEKLAHWIPITQEYLEDAARLAAITSGRLMTGVRRKAEKQAAAALVAATLPTATHTTLAGAIRVGIAQTQANGFVPNVIVLNPFDWADIDIDLLARTLNGAKGNQTLWSIDNIVAAPAVAAGTAYTGDMLEGATVFARSEVQLRMTDSHADYFISNKLVILAEQRVKTIITQPAAIVECTVTVGP